MLPTSDETNELEEMAENLRVYLNIYLEGPTATGYHFLKNKIAEYYSISQAGTEDAYAREKDRLRAELGIKPLTILPTLGIPDP
jgi:hypothetical protein